MIVNQDTYKITSVKKKRSKSENGVRDILFSGWKQKLAKTVTICLYKDSMLKEKL